MRNGIGYSIMSGAGETYIAAYALFLGATAAHVSLLAALPPLFGALTQLFAAWLATRINRRRRLILTGVLMQAFTWLPIVWLPYLFPAQAVPAMVSCIVMYYGWLGFSSPLWASLMGELVPARKRGDFFGQRMLLMRLAGFLALLAAGLTLQFFELRDNLHLAFVLIFTAAAAARLCSAYHLARMHEPAAAVTQAAPAPPLIPPPDSRFARFATFVTAMSFATAVANPFITMYMLKDLGLSYLEFMAATAVSIALQLVSVRAWGRLADLYGNRAILAVVAFLIPLVPLLWLLSPALAWVVCVQALAGWTWAGYDLAVGNYLYDVTPADRRASYCAVHNLTSSVGTCLGALLGGLLSVKLPPSIELFGHMLQWKSGLWGVLLLSALLRALVLLAFLPRLADVRPRRGLSLRVLVLAMLRFNPLGDFIYRRLSRRRRQSAGSPASLDA